jgi:trans-aconitate methyltransferase
MDRTDFYKDYNNIILKCCKPYEKFLKIAANAVPEGTNSVCELGVGTGNFSRLVGERFPAAKMYGVDNTPAFLDIAASRVGNFNGIEGDLNYCKLPKVDYFISSLALHHLDTSKRKERLTEIVRNSKGLINFDFVLDNEHNFDDSVQLTMDFVKKSFTNKKTLENIESEMRLHDNPMHIDEQREIFESLGMNFEILAKHSPHIIYRAFW